MNVPLPLKQQQEYVNGPHFAVYELWLWYNGSGDCLVKSMSPLETAFVYFTLTSFQRVVSRVAVNLFHARRFVLHY